MAPCGGMAQIRMITHFHSPTIQKCFDSSVMAILDNKLRTQKYLKEKALFLQVCKVFDLLLRSQNIQLRVTIMLQNLFMETGRELKVCWQSVWHWCHGHRYVRGTDWQGYKIRRFPKTTLLFGQMDFISCTNALMIHIYLPMLTI